jgi:hypothetical protein
MSNILKNNIENCDLMENLVPLWENKNLSEVERVLIYTCVVLNERCINLNNKITELETKNLKKNAIVSSNLETNSAIINTGGNLLKNNQNTYNKIDILKNPHTSAHTSTNKNYSLNPYLKEELLIDNKKHRDKKSSKKNIYDIKKSIKDVKRTLEELKKTSKK